MPTNLGHCVYKLQRILNINSTTN